jgi:tetratricopeptide (TPR) repeat protein
MVLVMLIAAASALYAKEKPVIPAGPSVTKGDPPPGNAMSLSVRRARVVLRETIKAMWAGTENVFTQSAARDISISSSGVAFIRDAVVQGHKFYDNREWWDFKGEKTDYFKVFGYHFEKVSQQFHYVSEYNSRQLTSYEGRGAGPECPALLWSNQADAQKFADAFNRLLYAAYHPGDEDKEFAAFTAAAKAWRENPVKPPLSAETERQRILAENAIQEKNLDDAIEHYESGVEAQPTWPAGWYNLALIYAEQKNYADAADRMKHYLELAPDAPDAKDARTQMIIWEDKAAKQQ